MISRRREQMTLDSLTAAVQMLGEAREERKGVLLISEGWRLFKPNTALTRRLGCSVPQRTIAVDPRTGRLTTSADAVGNLNSGPSCEGDRQALAQLDNLQAFTRLTQVANRANVTFYSIDPRGLTPFDTPIDQQRTGLVAPGQFILPTPAQDSAALAARQSALRDPRPTRMASRS